MQNRGQTFSMLHVVSRIYCRSEMNIELIRKDLDKIERDIEKKYQRKHVLQAEHALEEIESVRILMKSREKQYIYELKMLDKMTSYVHKYKFLPESYGKMLNLWTAYFLGKYSR